MQGGRCLHEVILLILNGLIERSEQKSPLGKSICHLEQKRVQLQRSIALSVKHNERYGLSANG
jgi:hypothetical protein